MGLMFFVQQASAQTPAGGGPQTDMMPQSWRYVEAFEQTLPDDDQWWKTFQDPTLNALIAEAVERNYNVAMAARRMEIARQTLVQARSQYFPTLGLNAGWTKSRSSGAMSSANLPATNASYFSLGADASWQVDLFGKISAQVRDKKTLFEASRAQYVGAMVTLCADVATYYVNLRTQQAQLEVARRHIQSQDSVVSKTRARYQAQLASKVDVAQALTVYYSTQASIPGLETSIASNINAIAVLLNEPADQMRARLEVPQPMPTHLQLVSAGTPMQLVRRRPDIVAAELQLAAAACELGIAKKDFLPTLTVDGSIGASSHAAKNMFKNNSLTWSVAPRLSWTAFDGKSRKAAEQSAKLAMENAMDDYNLTMATAVQEVDNAMTAYLNSLRTIDLDTKVYEQSQETFSLAMNLYTSGLGTFTNVMNAQMTMLQYANALVTTRGNAIVSLIDLYRALGGGYSSDLPSVN